MAWRQLIRARLANFPTEKESTENIPQPLLSGENFHDEESVAGTSDVASVMG